MKTLLLLLFTLACSGSSFAQGMSPSASLPPPSDSPAAPPAPGSPALPAAGFAPDRYQALWMKSPFAVATSETVGEESPDYYLVGVANQDGVFYASVIERQNQEHFLLSSNKPERGLTLKSINRSRDGQDIYAEVIKDGQPLTLKMEQAPAGAGPGPIANGNMPANMPGTMAPQIPMPGGGAGGFPNNGSVRPFTRFHRPPIRLPPQTPAANPSPEPPPPPPQ